MNHHSTFIFLHGIISLLQSVHAQTCYFPNKTAAEEGFATPCDTTEENSACCFPGDACLSNGFCFQQSTEEADWNLRIARGLCTDQTWGSPNCPQFCQDVFPGGTVTLELVSDLRQGQWCCGGWPYNNNTHCSEETNGSKNPFILPNAQIIYDRATGATVSANYSTNSSSITATQTVTVTDTIAVGTGSGSNQGHVTAIAAGVAAPLGILSLVSLGLAAYFWIRLKHTRTLLHGDSQSPPHRSGHPSTRDDAKTSFVPQTQLHYEEVPGAFDWRHAAELGKENQAQEFPANPVSEVPA